MVLFDDRTYGEFYFGRHYKNSYGQVMSNKGMQRGICFVLRSLGAICFANQ